MKAAEAERIAHSLDSRNRERQKIERSISDEAIGAVRARFNPETDPEEWGVILRTIRESIAKDNGRFTRLASTIRGVSEETTTGVIRLRALFPQARLFAMYGLTEAFRSTFLDPALIDSHPTSMGKAIPHAEILVIADDGAVADDGVEGELVHCGPLVAQGYWQDPIRTAERFKPAPSASHYGGTAVWSGDRVKRDADGLLYFVGRRDAMIKSAGNRISPQEIEEAALASGLVAEAVALGIPDPRLGHAIHLIVRAVSNISDAEEELPRKLLKSLPNFMQPKVIHWRTAMPISPNGKIDRTGLYQELAA